MHGFKISSSSLGFSSHRHRAFSPDDMSFCPLLKTATPIHWYKYIRETPKTETREIYGGVVVSTDAQAAGGDGVLFRDGGGAVRCRSSSFTGQRGPTTEPGQGSQEFRQRPTKKAP